MFSPQQFALQMMESNPNFARNPYAQQLVEIIRNGDQKRGEELANNILNTYGVSKEDAISKAKQFFHF